MKVKYELIHKEKNTAARYGTLETNYGKYETPMFMPVGTQATVKTLDYRAKKMNQLIAEGYRTFHYVSVNPETKEITTLIWDNTYKKITTVALIPIIKESSALSLFINVASTTAVMPIKATLKM